MAPLIQITADEVNQIIYSYLQDSGFLHTAFALRVEGRLEHSKYFNEYIPRGELVELLTKALLYTEVETHCKGDGLITDCKAPFSLLKRHECAVDLMDDAVSGTAEKVERLSVSNGVVEPPLKRKAAIPAEGDAQGRRVKRSLEPESGDTNTVPSRNSPASVPDERISSERDASPMSGVPAPSAAQFNGTEPLNRSGVVREAGPGDNRTHSKAILTLTGHTAEVFVSAWNPVYHGVLATGAKDATVRIWELPDPPDDPSQFAEHPEKPPIVLRHLPHHEHRDVTSVDWNADGTLLATGALNSILRIWTRTGESYMFNPQHQGAIFGARFSKSGKWLLSCSLDGTACVWDVVGKKLHMQFRCHEDCCLDAVWLDESIFATCGADKVVNIMRIGEQNPLLTLRGHENEVNSIRFNPSKTRLASCSDDRTVRIWETARFLAESQHENMSATVLGGHSDTIASLSWCPNRPESAHEIIATVAFDGSVYIWDATEAVCLHTIHDHKRAAYTLTFSPDGKYLATGGGDGWLYVYRVETGKQVWSWYSGSDRSGIYEVNWQQTGRLNRIVSCLDTGAVAIVDVTRVPPLTESE